MTEGTGSKVTRGLSISIEPISKSSFGVAFKDRTTRSNGEQRRTEEIATADSGTQDAVLEKIGIVFKEFRKSLGEENQGELYGDPGKSEKPRRDPK